MFLIRLGLCTALLIAMPSVLAMGQRLDTLPRVDGEYGLRVLDEDREVEVQWLTRGLGPGFLRVFSADSLVGEFETQFGLAHRVKFDRPSADAYRIEYGGVRDPDDRHATTIVRTPDRSDPVITGVDSLFVVGDVHGEFDNLTTLLRNAGLVDDDLAWTGGRSHLVLLGDVFDRGPDVTPVLWLVYRLEREAETTGGGVHLVLGNHEIMVLTEDLRYTHPKEQLLAYRHGETYGRLFDVRRTVLGRWLATRPALLRIDGTLLAHGGVTDRWLDYTVRSFNDSLATFMSEDLFYWWADTTRSFPIDSAAFVRRLHFFWDPTSIFWDRGYVCGTTSAESLDRVLDHFATAIHVVANTPVDAITELFGGDVIAVDTAEPAREMLLLVRGGSGYERWRVNLEGPPTPLPAGGPHAPISDERYALSCGPVVNTE